MVRSSSRPLGVITLKSAAWPPGRTCGQRWLISWPATGVVRGRGAPPEAGTCQSPLHELGAKTIVPCEPQLAPRRLLAGHRVSGSPPWIRIAFMWPSASKPNHCPSGEKKGLLPPCVPAIGFASSWSNGRS